MKTLKRLFLITAIIGSSLSLIAQESLFKDYLIAYNKAVETKNVDYIKQFKNDLTIGQREYLDLKMDYYRAKKNKEDDPCSSVSYKSLQEYTDYEALLYAEQNDPAFFSECELWGALRFNTARTKEQKLKAVEILKKLAEQGSARIQYNIALEYGWYRTNKKMRLEKDPDQYFKYMKMAAKQGYSDADYRMSDGYDHIKDYKNAVIWLKKAIANGTDERYLGKYRWELGEYYEKGLGVEKDINKALDFYKLAANSSINTLYPDYAFDLGLMLYEGTGVFPRDRDLGLKYIKKAARTGDFGRAKKYCKKNGIYF